MPSPGSGDDAVWLGAPLERIEMVILCIDVGVDDLPQGYNRVEDTTLETALGEMRKEFFDAFSQEHEVGTKRRSSVDNARTTLAPCEVCGRLLVKDHMDQLLAGISRSIMLRKPGNS